MFAKLYEGRNVISVRDVFENVRPRGLKSDKLVFTTGVAEIFIRRNRYRKYEDTVMTLI